LLDFTPKNNAALFSEQSAQTIEGIDALGRTRQMTKNNMASDVRKVNIHKVLRRCQARYEIHPYYVASPGRRKVQAGSDVDLYGTVETWRLPGLAMIPAWTKLEAVLRSRRQRLSSERGVNWRLKRRNRWTRQNGSQVYPGLCIKGECRADR
jgi:hypothetical protein